MNIICCDVDGTLTEFEKFVLKYGVIFLKRFYNIRDIEINYEGYDFDEVFLNQKLAQYFEKIHGISVEKVLKKFWTVFYPMYIAQKMKPGASHFFRELSKESEIFITTSRTETTSKSLLGLFVRKTVIAQLRMNFIPFNDIYFFENDDDKIEFIKKTKPIMVFDDKPTIIQELAKDTKVVCLKAAYNENYDLDALVIDGYGEEELAKTLQFRRK